VARLDEDGGKLYPHGGGTSTGLGYGGGSGVRRIILYDKGAGSASRFFPCFTSEHEVLRWLVRLIGCQPGSTILDPFENCKVKEAVEAEGFRYVGGDK